MAKARRNQGGGLSEFLRITRAQLKYSPAALRLVWRSELAHQHETGRLADFLSDCAPRFYRDPGAMAQRLDDGYYLTAIKEALERLPKARNFQESHLAEIIACLFAEEVLKLRLLYSKLAQLSAENSNAYKIDLLLYDPAVDPVRFVFGEVKSSVKQNSPDQSTINAHSKSCYADIFNSLRKYSEEDVSFDLTSARDRIEKISNKREREKIRQALLPYQPKDVTYAAFAVIDQSTYGEADTDVLGRRKSNKVFDVDVICVERFNQVVTDTFGKISYIRSALCSPTMK